MTQTFPRKFDVSSWNQERTVLVIISKHFKISVLMLIQNKKENCINDGVVSKY